MNSGTMWFLLFAIFAAVAGSLMYTNISQQPDDTAVIRCAILNKDDDFKRFDDCYIAANLGRPESQTELGLMYEYGEGVGKDLVEAVRLYTLAAEQGFARAQTNLGYMYQHGRGVERSLEEAFYWYRLAATQGHARGQTFLGTFFENGVVVEQDLNEALNLYTLAAEQGYAWAQFNLGKWHDRLFDERYNLIAPQLRSNFDNSEAIRWYTLAVEQGDADAQASLASIYQSGKGVEIDNDAAFQLYLLSAKQGNLMAQNNLGGMYFRGEGAIQNYIRAHMWFNIASSTHGDNTAIYNREFIEGIMDARSIVEAQALAERCIESGYVDC